MDRGLFFYCGTECGRSGAVIGRSAAVYTRHGAQWAHRVNAGDAAGAGQSVTITEPAASSLTMQLLATYRQVLGFSERFAVSAGHSVHTHILYFTEHVLPHYEFCILNLFLF